MEGFCCTLLSMSLAAALTALGVIAAVCAISQSKKVAKRKAAEQAA